jgi:hypothetical protein
VFFVTQLGGADDANGKRSALLAFHVLFAEALARLVRAEVSVVGGFGHCEHAFGERRPFLALDVLLALALAVEPIRFRLGRRAGRSRAVVRAGYVNAGAGFRWWHFGRFVPGSEGRRRG